MGTQSVSKYFISNWKNKLTIQNKPTNQTKQQTKYKTESSSGLPKQLEDPERQIEKLIMSKSGQDQKSTSSRKTVCDNNQAPKNLPLRPTEQPEEEGPQKRKKCSSTPASLTTSVSLTTLPYPKQTKKVPTNGSVHNGTLPQDTNKDQKWF